MVDAEIVKQVAHLARLHLADNEIEKMTSDLSQIIGFVEQIQEIETTGVEPMSHPLDLSQRLRNDEVSESVDRSQFMNIAPATEAGLYLVPNVLD